jgi:hypothetical protein
MTDNTGASALTISAAARMVGVDRRVIRRHLEAGRFSRAERAPGDSGTGTGPWQIPFADLLDAGLLPSYARQGPEGVEGVAGMEGTEGMDAEPPLPRDLGLEFSRLRAELAAAIRRAETAEATLLESERIIEAQRLALAERSSVSARRRGPRPTSQNDRRPFSGSAARRPTASASFAVTTDRRSGSEPDDAAPTAEDAPRRSNEDARVSAAMAEATEETEAVDQADEVDEVDEVDRPRFTPLFATSWASAPPWEHIPKLNNPAQRRWWKRVS